jgi:ATP-dependent phosphofructokinase / diphosphate-dependent phosphofructokinase
MREPRGTLAILVGGGPAPGINAVISATAIEAINEGFKVLGVQDGFKWLVRRDPSHLRELSISDVSRIHLLGGSWLGTSRENPTKAPEKVQAVVETLLNQGVTHLVTIGGDDTALSSSTVAESSGGRIRAAHVPKTIDNDLPLPPHIPTFGFQTARHVGVELVQNLMEDARSTKRWYVVVAMGRKAGFLALGIGKAAGATLTLIGEEFKEPFVSFAKICDIVEGSIVKRLADGRSDGVAVLAEGLIERLNPEEIADLQDVERDDHGHIRFAEIDLARRVKVEVQGRLAHRGIKTQISHKTIGYELRCAPPIPFDAEYCRDLGYAAVRYLLSGEQNALVSIQGGKLVPLPFSTIRDPQTGKTKVRYVDTDSSGFKVAQRYMIRVDENDFARPETVSRLAAAAHLTPEEFRQRFEYLAK